ncbi:MAG: hypothetical protein DMG67_11045 [Acidobacteria bacterium]|nr:MAG: hypothetical protein DMG67_11045 [Acidobacteriota bacterium]
MLTTQPDAQSASFQMPRTSHAVDDARMAQYGQKQSPATVLQPRFNPADKQHIAVDVRDRMQEGPPHHSGWGGPLTL